MSSEFTATVGASSLRYRIQAFNSGSGPVADFFLSVSLYEDGGYEFEDHRDNADAYALAVAEGVRAGRQAMSGGTWTVEVTRTALFEGGSGDPVPIP